MANKPSRVLSYMSTCLRANNQLHKIYFQNKILQLRPKLDMKDKILMK